MSFNYDTLGIRLSIKTHFDNLGVISPFSLVYSPLNYFDEFVG